MAPKQKPGRSKQDYWTPPEFLDAVRKTLGVHEFDVDLAADDGNAIALEYFTAQNSAFDAQTWRFASGWNWLNPPYSAIGPWVERAYLEARDNRAKTAVLIPASVGANWWRDWVHNKALVLFLNGRLTFVGCTAPYPKDCALLLYDPFLVREGMTYYDVWSWARG